MSISRVILVSFCDLLGVVGSLKFFQGNAQQGSKIAARVILVSFSAGVWRWRSGLDNKKPCKNRVLIFKCLVERGGIETPGGLIKRQFLNVHHKVHHTLILKNILFKYQPHAVARE